MNDKGPADEGFGLRELVVPCFVGGRHVLAGRAAMMC